MRRTIQQELFDEINNEIHKSQYNCIKNIKQIINSLPCTDCTKDYCLGDCLKEKINNELRKVK